MNKEEYSAISLEDFIASCALADSTAFKYLYGQFKLSGISSSSIQTIVNHLNSTYNTSVDFFKYKDNAASTYELVLSFGNISTENLLQAKNYIVNDSASLTYTYRYGKSLNTDTLGIIYVPADINAASWQPSLASAMSTDLFGVDSFDVTVVFSADPAATTMAYKKYVIHNVSGLPFYKLVQYSDTLNKILYNNTYGVQTYTAYNPFINLDYYKQEKKDFLGYNYGLNDSIHYMIIRKLSADSLKTNIASYASKNVTYDNPYITNDDGDLFVSTNQYSDPGFIIADSIIACVTRQHNFADPFYQPVNNALFFANVHQRIYPPYPGPASTDSLNVYRCGDNKTYWYRYFKHNKLYNMYIQLPDFIQNGTSWRYYPGSFQVGQGDGYIYRFNLTIVNPSYPSLRVKVYGYTDFAMGTILDMRKSMLCLGTYDGQNVPDTTTCERYTLNDAIQEGKHDYIIYRDSTKQKITSDYTAFLDSSIQETMYLTTRDQKYQFTVYYHDRAGNLTRTVPPAGVMRMDSTMTLNDLINTDRKNNTVETITMPVHTKPSFYTYNSINNVIQQITPDGGTVNYYYDAVGRVVFSQNDVERPYGTVAYTLYDPQGRIIETGEMYAACPATCESCIPGLLPQITNSSNFTLLELYNFIVGSRRSQVVATRYDDEYIDLSTIDGMSRQQNLRKRVSVVKFIPLLSTGQLGNNVSTYTHAAHYSYDIQGNVKTLTHDYPNMPVAIHRYKRVDYDYDMLSGKVNMLSYNRGFGDQFYQRYSYDADNRLTKAETSKDGIYWDDDADYQYYKHGPLARMELGDRRVQALDYAYTLQGWMKAVNGDIRDTAYDMGGDGRKNSIFPPDVFSYALDYFPADYKPIGDSLVMHIADVTKGLYNGNIGRQTTSMQPVPPLVKEYRYDPLNRITNGQYYDIDSSHSLVTTDAYKSHYTYDPDGNFKTLKRYGGSVTASHHTGVIMDSLTYYLQYHSNQLFQVKDSADNHYGTVDIQKSGYEDLGTFYYDEIGRLIQDRRTIPDEDSIHWSLYNKVTELGMDGVPRMRFSYDGAGNRLTKTNYSYADSTGSMNTDYYVRDASGNILAIMNYEEDYGWRRVPLIIFWHNVLLAAANNPVVVSPYITDPHFMHAVIAQAHAQANAILSPIGPAALIRFDPSTVLNPCIEVTRVIDAVINNGPAPLVHATELETPLDLAQFMLSPHDTTLTTTMDTTGGDTTYIYHAGPGRMHTAIDYWVANWPQTFDSLCHIMGIGLYDTVMTDSLRLVNEDSLIVYHTDFVNYAGMLLGGNYDSTNFSRRDSMVFAWFADSSLYFGGTGTSSTLGGSGGGGSVGGTVGGTIGSVTTTPKPLDWTEIQWEALLRHLYDSTALADSDKALFAADLVDSGMNMAHLVALDDTNRILEVAYLYNPDSFISKWLSAASDTQVATALSAMPDMTAARGLHDMNDLLHLNLDAATVLRYIVVGQRYGLSEHHLYGTSRLGVRDYAAQFGSYWQWSDTSGYVSPDSSYVNTHVPWYSRAMGDFMQNNVSEPVWTHLDYGKWYTTRILGLKRYELTSHLGDVQSTILDRTTRWWDSPPTHILRTHADISTYTDYYPFGMPMPGRQVINDTSMIDTFQMPNPDQFVQYNPDSSVLPDNYPAQRALALGNWSLWPQDSIVTGHLEWLGSGNGLVVACDTAVDSISAGKFGTKLFIPTDSGTSYTLTLVVDNNNAGILGAVAYANLGGGGSSITTLATQPIHSSGTYVLHFSAVNDSTWVAIGSPSMDSGTSFRLAAAKMNNVIEVVANGFLVPAYYGKKNYRFAYNGKEKVSEISGEGNHYIYGVREYDPRLGVFWSVDPLTKQYPWYSSYQFAGLKPIMYVDLDGKEEGDPVEDLDEKEREEREWETRNLLGNNNAIRVTSAEAERNLEEVLKLKEEAVEAEKAEANPLTRQGQAKTDRDRQFETNKPAQREQFKKIFPNMETPEELKDKEPVTDDANRPINTKQAQERASRLSQRPRPGEDFTKAGKEAVKDLNKAENGDEMKCENCGINVKNAKQHTRGYTPPNDEAHIDHIAPKSTGGSGTPNNGQVLCRGCNLEKGSKTP